MKGVDFPARHVSQKGSTRKPGSSRIQGMFYQQDIPAPACSIQTDICNRDAYYAYIIIYAHVHMRAAKLSMYRLWYIPFRCPPSIWTCHFGGTAPQFEPPLTVPAAMETSRGLRKRRLSPGSSVADAKRQRGQRRPLGLVDFVRPSQAVAWRQPGPVSGVNFSAGSVCELGSCLCRWFIIIHIMQDSWSWLAL